MHMRCSGDQRLAKYAREIFERAGYSLVEEESCINAIDELTKDEQKRMLRAVQSDHAGFTAILDQVDILLSLYQRVDSKKRTPLAYYQQSEWRLPYYSLRGASEKGFTCLQRVSQTGVDPNAIHEVIDLLHAIRDFKARVHGKRPPRLELRDHFLFCGNANVSLRDVIVEIVVPVEAVARVRQELCKASLEAFFPKLKVIAYNYELRGFDILQVPQT